MSNPHPPQNDHIEFIVGCVTLLCAICAIGAIILIIKGYDAGGGQMTMAVNSGISGLVGFLARGVLQAVAAKSEINTRGPTNITNQPEATPPTPNENQT